MKVYGIDLTTPEIRLEIKEDCEIVGLFVGKESMQYKTKLQIIHALPGLQSRINLKAVLFDQSRFDLEAVLVIEKGAAFTDTYLKAEALVMSEFSFARLVPSMEIKENEVKGGHGATVGQLDAQQLFYLQSRGYARESAQQLLVDTFINEINFKLQHAESL